MRIYYFFILYYAYFRARPAYIDNSAVAHTDGAQKSEFALFVAVYDVYVYTRFVFYESDEIFAVSCASDRFGRESVNFADFDCLETVDEIFYRFYGVLYGFFG